MCSIYLTNETNVPETKVTNVTNLPKTTVTNVKNVTNKTNVPERIVPIRVKLAETLLQPRHLYTCIMIALLAKKV